MILIADLKEYYLIGLDQTNGILYLLENLQIYIHLAQFSPLTLLCVAYSSKISSHNQPNLRRI